LTKFYGVPKNEAVAPLTGLLHYKGIVNDDKDILLEALALFAGKSLDLADCMVLIRAEKQVTG
jgi:predicted nucleic-acid-binding protein